MKKSYLIGLFVIWMGATAAVGQSLGTSSVSGSVFAPCTLGADDITQSLDCSLVAETSIVCSGGGITADNRFLRRFFLNEDHGIIDSYLVQALEFGIQSAVSGPLGSACPGNPITVNCYSIPSGRELLYSNLNLLDSSSLNLHQAPDLSFVTARMNGSCRIGDPLTRDLVIEIVTCDHFTGATEGGFFVGTNDLGETRPSYIATDVCSFPEPEALDDLGFPDSDYVWVIQGRERNLGSTGAFIGEPQTRRRPSGIDVEFDVKIARMHGDAAAAVYVELQDLRGNLIAGRELGWFSLAAGEELRLSESLRAPEFTAPGTYALVGKIPGEGRLIQFKKLVQLP